MYIHCVIDKGHLPTVMPSNDNDEPPGQLTTRALAEWPSFKHLRLWGEAMCGIAAYTNTLSKRDYKSFHGYNPRRISSACSRKSCHCCFMDVEDEGDRFADHRGEHVYH